MTEVTSQCGTRGSQGPTEERRRGDFVVALSVLAAIAIAPLPAFAQVDSTLSAAPAPARVLLEADEIFEESSPRRVTATGNVEARYEGRYLRADRLTYDTTTGTVRAFGNVQIIEADGSVRYADEIQVDEKLGDGLATGLVATLPGNATLMANSALRRDQGTTEMRGAVYTACPICSITGARLKPTWSLRARKARQDADTQMISYRDVALDIKGVPVLYLPYFTHPDPTSKRRSGLLQPDLGQSSKFGAYLRQPYFWAVSPSQDLTITPLIVEKAAPVIFLDWAKEFYSGKVELSVGGTNERDLTGDGVKFGDTKWRSAVFGKARFDISPYWAWGVGLEHTSEDKFIRFYDMSGEGELRGPFSTRPNRLVTQGYIEGQDAKSSIRVAALRFQGLLETDVDNLTPTALPYISALRSFETPWVGGRVQVNFSAVGLDREDGIDSARASLGVNWRSQKIVGPGLMVEPFFEARSDQYRLKDQFGLDKEDLVARTVGTIGTVIRYPMVRPGTHADWLLEPVAMVAAGPANTNKWINDRNAISAATDPIIRDAAIAALPTSDPVRAAYVNAYENVIEDGLGFEMDETTLFRGNAAANYDYYEGGVRGSLGLRISAQGHKGSELSAFVGRRFRDDDDAAFNAGNNMPQGGSDYVAAFQGRVRNVLQFATRMRLDSDTLELKRIDASGQLTYKSSYLNVRYFNINDSLALGAPRNQLEIGSRTKVSKHFSLGYNVLRDIDQSKTLYQRIGVTYEDECAAIEVFYQRREFTDGALGPSDGFRVRVSLATLGTFGKNR